MIPKTFQLGGTEWTVEFKDDPTNTDGLGECFFSECKISIDKTCSGKRISESMNESTFYHELIHSFLSSGAYQDLTADENLVSHLGNCLHQFMKTKK